MVTQKGENTAVVALHGNFDEAQNGVKEMFEDAKLKEELQKPFFACLLRIPSISAGSYRRLFIMSMHTDAC